MAYLTALHTISIPVSPIYSPHSLSLMHAPGPPTGAASVVVADARPEVAAFLAVVVAAYLAAAYAAAV